jgi:hypothetical protein
MHGLGKAIYTTRTRKNRARAPLVELKAFDYNFQTWIDLPDDQAVLEPGEELSMTCVFDSRGRSNTTHWGFSTQVRGLRWVRGVRGAQLRVLQGTMHFYSCGHCRELHFAAAEMRAIVFDSRGRSNTTHWGFFTQVT